MPFSLPTSSPCFLHFLVPSLHVLPVSCESSYLSLYHPAPCSVVSTSYLRFLGEIALSFGTSRERSQTAVDTRMGGDQMDLTFPKSVYVRKKGPKGRRTKPSTQVPEHIFLTGEGGAVGRTLSRKASSAPPLTIHLKNRVGTLAFQFRRHVCLWSEQWRFRRKSYLSSYFFISSLQQLVNQRTERSKKTFTAIFQHERKFSIASHQLMPLEFEPSSSLRLFDVTLQIPDQCSVSKDPTIP